MRIVQTPTHQPAHCFVTGKSKHEEGFVDFGAPVPGIDPYPVITVGVAKQVGQLVGMVDPQEVEALKAQLEGVRAALQSAQDELDELRLRQEAIDTLESAGFRARHKPGPRPKVEA